VSALFRGLYEYLAASSQSLKQAPLLGLPAAGVPLVKSPAPPVVRWQGTHELLAWRAWRIANCVSRARDFVNGPCLVSLTAPCIWNGPVVRATLPSEIVDPPSGIYALKPRYGERWQWQYLEGCWVTGTVALSGRVIEHELGYRAERVVIRDLRLAVGTHLAVRGLDDLRTLIANLEERYQVSVDAGFAERQAADRMLHRGHQPKYKSIGWIMIEARWELI
jgi:hypothetical protein